MTTTKDQRQREREAQQDLLEMEHDRARARRFFWYWSGISFTVMVLVNALVPWKESLDPKVIATATAVIPPILAVVSMVAKTVLQRVVTVTDGGQRALHLSTVGVWCLWSASFALTFEAAVSLYLYGQVGVGLPSVGWTARMFPIVVDIPVVVSLSAIHALRPSTRRELRIARRSLAESATANSATATTVPNHDQLSANSANTNDRDQMSATTVRDREQVSATNVRDQMSANGHDRNREHATKALTSANTATTNGHDREHAQTNNGREQRDQLSATSVRAQTNNGHDQLSATDDHRDRATTLVDAGRTTLSVEQVSDILARSDEGHGPTQVSTETGIDRSKVNRLLRADREMREEESAPLLLHAVR